MGKYSTDFEDFWKTYPKKKSKGAAFRWWKKNKPTMELRILIREKLLLLRDSPDWKKQNGQFIPHPATWLNNDGWEDDVGSIQNQEVKKIALFPIGGNCCKCKLPAVYKSTAGAYDAKYCKDHMPKEVKELYA